MTNDKKTGAPCSLDGLVMLLKERPGLTCTEIGETLWGGTLVAIARDRQHYARPAGKLVKRAMERGLVRERYVFGKRHSRREFFAT